MGVVTPLFLAASNRTAMENRANLVVWTFLATILLIALLGFKGTLTEKDIVTIVVLAAVYFIGIEIGTRTHYRVDEKIVRRAVLGMVVVAAGASLVL